MTICHSHNNSCWLNINCYTKRWEKNQVPISTSGFPCSFLPPCRFSLRSQILERRTPKKAWKSSQRKREGTHRLSRHGWTFHFHSLPTHLTFCTCCPVGLHSEWARGGLCAWKGKKSPILAFPSFRERTCTHIQFLVPFWASASLWRTSSLQ